ncbi:proteophosphoglycan 5 [Rhodotorula toruloides]|uniref:Proteophosphoglycan 5 n=1 Tax=Rhodotorula toruloides TaxID=5286 RepID=A0A511KNJ6_RHOTO|nr:proteophosphoglycan 5 [Rhodotorula toruloides]
MTRPIPVTGQRKRPSKSCLACRASKTKCTGLSEEYLHALEDPDLLAKWEGPHPICSRCQKHDEVCSFAPSRRKGRPRRLLRDEAGNIIEDRSSSRSRQPVQLPSPEGSGERSPSPSNSSSSQETGSEKAQQPVPAFTFPASGLPTPLSPLRPLARFPPVDHTPVAIAFLQDAYPWVPLLPSDVNSLSNYLMTSDPLLPAAINCLLNPSLQPPSVDLASRVRPLALSTLQATTLLFLHAFAAQNKSLALQLLQWTCTELAARGWAGERTAGELQAEEGFIELGWYCWGMEIQLGIVVGARASILAHVSPPSIIDATTSQRHAFRLAFDATNYAHLWEIDPPAQSAYLTDIVGRSHIIHDIARSALASLPVEPALLSQAVLRHSSLLGALLSLASIILVLSSQSPLSPYIAPALPCSLDTTCLPPSPHRREIARAARGIVDVVKTFAGSAESPLSPVSSNGASKAAFYHPFFGCCLVVASRGLLLEAESYSTGDNSLCPSPPSSPIDQVACPAKQIAQIAQDLDLCERVLRGQAKRWCASEMLATEVSLLRRTAGVA